MFQVLGKPDKVMEHINNPGREICVVVPMDGFHYPKAYLDKMPNPTEAHNRRGACWTFDSQYLYKKLVEVKNSDEASVPSFEHHIGDPVEDAIRVKKHHKIILIPGNYMLLNNPDLDGGFWAKIYSILDITWFIDIDVEVAMEQVVRRHMKAWHWTREQAVQRVNINDRPNALQIDQSKKNAQELILYVEDTTWIGHV